jgi:hypothetical protein
MTDVATPDTTADGSVTGTQEPATTTATAAAATAQGTPETAKAEATTGTLLTSSPDTSSASEPTVPETYALSLPDESPLDSTALDRVSELAKTIALTSDEQAQAIVDALHAEVADFEQALLESNAKGGAMWKARVEEMEKQALADPEIGGSPEKLQQSVQKGQRVLEKFGDENVREFLEESGLGSSPALLRMLARIHHAISEDAMVLPDKVGKPEPKTLAERIYSNL